MKSLEEVDVVQCYFAIIAQDVDSPLWGHCKLVLT